MPRPFSVNAVVGSADLLDLVKRTHARPFPVFGELKITRNMMGSVVALSQVDVQRNYLWTIQLPVLGRLPQSASEALLINNANMPAYRGQNALSPEVANIVSDRCQSVKFGDYRLDQMVMRWGPFQRKFAGLPNIENMTMTFLEGEDGLVIEYFRQWRMLIIPRAKPPVGGETTVKKFFYNEKSKYAGTIRISLLKKVGGASVMFRCSGCFPLPMPMYDLNYNDDRVVTHSIDFSVDDITEEVVK